MTQRYLDRVFCESDCRNLCCWRYLDQGVRADAARAGQVIEARDFVRACHNYLPPKERQNEQ